MRVVRPSARWITERRRRSSLKAIRALRCGNIPADDASARLRVTPFTRVTRCDDLARKLLRQHLRHISLSGMPVDTSLETKITRDVEDQLARLVIRSPKLAERAQDPVLDRRGKAGGSHDGARLRHSV